MWNIIKILGKKMAGLIKLILMVGFSGILDIGKEEDLKMIRDKSIGGKNC